jgi:hypothetical protein
MATLSDMLLQLRHDDAAFSDRAIFFHAFHQILIY